MDVRVQMSEGAIYHQKQLIVELQKSQIKISI